MCIFQNGHFCNLYRHYILNTYYLTLISKLPKTMSVGVGSIFESVCLPVCLSVCPQHNSKMNDPKVFKLGVRRL